MNILEIKFFYKGKEVKEEFVIFILDPTI